MVKYLLCTVVLACCLTQVHAQCSSGLFLEKTSENGLEIRVQSNGGFVGKLLEISGVGTKVKETFTGSSTRSYAFEGLTRDLYYKVEVEFAGEEKFLCKKKVLAIFELGSK